MKKIFTIFAAITLFMSCDEDRETIDSLSYPADAFITFNETTAFVGEESITPLIIKVLYANTSSANEDITIDFTVASNNGTLGNDYTILDNKSSFTFSPSNGIYTDNVQIMPLDNLVLGEENIVITLTLGSSTYSNGYPGPDSLGETITVTILDDDCAKEEALRPYQGDWLGSDSCGDYTGVPVTLTLPCGTGITIKGLGHPWLEDPGYWDELVVFEYDVLITIDEAAGTVTIPEQVYVTTLFDGEESDYSILGSGTIDTSGAQPVITISYDMKHPQYGSMANDFAGTSCAGLFGAVITLQ
jgi:hypothetical protein